MPFAITLRFDPDSVQAIDRLWDALAAAGIDSDRQKLGYAAHVTLAIYPNETAVERLRAAVDRVGNLWDTLPIALSGLGLFPGPPAILFAAPVMTSALLARQAELLALLPDLPMHPH